MKFLNQRKFENLHAFIISFFFGTKMMAYKNGLFRDKGREREWVERNSNFRVLINWKDDSTVEK